MQYYFNQLYKYQILNEEKQERRKMSNIITKNLNKIIMTYICGREREKENF
jgi:hypothetical protein